MSKKNKSQETEAKTLDTTVLQGAPTGLSFEEMQKAVTEFKRLQKLIKELPKEEREKLLPPTHKREIPESLSVLADYIKKGLISHYDNIKPEFDKTVTTEKPDGNKSISLSWEDCDFSVAIIRKIKKSKKE